MPFQQPAGVPSRVAFFNALIKLNHILSFSLKLLVRPSACLSVWLSLLSLGWGLSSIR